ncbi:MAG: DUF1365 domain-containing protein [Mycobacteriales bacterium]|nr:MAG: DUF1365 domain-containing protein [Pseudonocardiales bacterium]
MAPAPAIYRARITHSRTERGRRGFAYIHDYWLVDLDRLPRLPLPGRLAELFRAGDHLGDPRRSIRENVVDWLRANDVVVDGRVLMLTTPRAPGHVFNPLSLFWCYGADGALRCVIAEVHNTYGERHCYLLDPDDAGRAEVDKAFYVSPFQAMGGSYELRVAPPDDGLHVGIALRQGGATPFTANMSGRRAPLTRRAMARSLLRHPFGAYRISALIRYEGIKLALGKIPIQRRPIHTPQKGVQAP